MRCMQVVTPADRLAVLRDYKRLLDDIVGSVRGGPLVRLRVAATLDGDSEQLSEALQAHSTRLPVSERSDWLLRMWDNRRFLYLLADMDRKTLRDVAQSEDLWEATTWVALPEEGP